VAERKSIVDDAIVLALQQGRRCRFDATRERHGHHEATTTTITPASDCNQEHQYLSLLRCIPSDGIFFQFTQVHSKRQNFSLICLGAFQAVEFFFNLLRCIPSGRNFLSFTEICFG
jgi:hypothetical protein